MILLSLGFLARVMQFWLSPDSRQFPIQGADSFYHMRRILIALFEPGKLGPLDYYQGMGGAEPCLWPVSYSYLHALFVWVASLGQASYDQAIWLAALTPPLWGVMTAGLLILLCLRWGKPMALAVGALYLLLPQNIYLASLGAVDHHAGEVFCLTLASFWLIQTIEQPQQRAWIGLALALVAMYAIWSGSTLYVGMLGLFSLLWGWRSPLVWPAIANSFLLGGLLLLPLSSWNGQSWSLQISYSHASLFQPLLLLLGGLVFLSLSLGLRRHKFFLPVLALLLVLTAFVGLQLLQGIDFLFGKGGGYDFIGEIAELQPMSWQKLPDLFHSLTPLLIFCPVFVWLSLKEGFKAEDSLPCLVGLLFLLSLVLMVRAERFLYLTSLWAAPLFVWGIAKIMAQRQFKAVHQMVLSLVLALICLVSITPKVLAIWRSPALPQGEIQALAEWLRHNSPQSQDVLQQNQMPAYSVLAPWDLGHYLLYTAQRAVVSNNFGLNAGLHEAFLLAHSEAQALKLLKPFKARYVLLNTRPLLQSPNSLPEWLLNTRIDHAGKTFDLSLPSADFLSSLYARLFFEDGSQGLSNPQQAFQHLRLSYESSEMMTINLTPYAPQNPPYFMLYGTDYPEGFAPYQKQVARYKLFEVVPGATLRGQAAPATKIVLQTQVQTPHGRSFAYTQSTETDAQGHYHFIVPYGSSADPRQVRTSQPYQIEGALRPVIQVPVTQAQVLSGREIMIP